MTQTQNNYVPVFDPLEHFAHWFMRQPLGDFLTVAPKNGIMSYGKVVALCLYRQGEFQVELFISTERGGFPHEHRHPNVDSFECHIAGDIFLTVNGESTASREAVEGVRPDGSSPIAGFLVRVRPGDFHGAHEDSEGAFLSIQRWMNGVTPTSVGLDWWGEPPHELHAQKLAELGNSGVPDGEQPAQQLAGLGNLQPDTTERKGL